LSVPVQVIAWRAVSEMTCNVLSGTLNLTHSLTRHFNPWVHSVMKDVVCMFCVGDAGYVDLCLPLHVPGVMCSGKPMRYLLTL